MKIRQFYLLAFYGADVPVTPPTPPLLSLVDLMIVELVKGLTRQFTFYLFYCTFVFTSLRELSSVASSLKSGIYRMESGYFSFLSEFYKFMSK